MTRVIKASALTNEQHAGLYVSHHGCPTPERLLKVRKSLTFAYLYWPGGVATSVRLTDEITIHAEPERQP
jgi:hypothetical protein